MKTLPLIVFDVNETLPPSRRIRLDSPDYSDPRRAR